MNPHVFFMKTYRNDCNATGFCPDKISRLARRLSKVAGEIDAMGAQIFGAEGTALYIIAPGTDAGRGEPHVLADCEQRANGGISQCQKLKNGNHSLSG